MRNASDVFLTPVVVGELLFGFAGGGLEQQNRALLREFLDSERVDVLAIDEETAERYAVIRDQLRHQGIAIPANDVWIAASAAQHGLVLVTLDSHFRNVPQVLVEYFEPSA